MRDGNHHLLGERHLRTSRDHPVEPLTGLVEWPDTIGAGHEARVGEEHLEARSVGYQDMTDLHRGIPTGEDLVAAPARCPLWTVLARA
jgi:hypothetical protein